MKTFQNLSDVSIEEAKKILKDIALKKPGTQCAKRADEYMELRHYYEEILRCELNRAGTVRINACGDSRLRGLRSRKPIGFRQWVVHNSAFIKIDLDEFDKSTLSFTYGDSHPTFSKRVNDGKEYRKKLYAYDEILAIIAKYGYPQNWNNDGKYGPERYVEAHIWSDDVVKRYM